MFPTIEVVGTEMVGFLVVQCAGLITVYRGMDLFHTKTVGRGSETWRDRPKRCGRLPRALGLALVQKSGLYQDRLVQENLLQNLEYGAMIDEEVVSNQDGLSLSTDKK